MKIKTVLLFLLTTCLSCSYSDKGDLVDKKELIGKFVYQTDNWDTIEINSNSSYSYYKWWNGKKLENSGTWTYDSVNGRVNFHDFSFFTGKIMDGTEDRGVWSSRIRVEDDEIRLVYARELYKAYFLKVDSIDRGDR